MVEPRQRVRPGNEVHPRDAGGLRDRLDGAEERVIDQGDDRPVDRERVDDLGAQADLRDRSLRVEVHQEGPEPPLGQRTRQVVEQCRSPHAALPLARGQDESVHAVRLSEVKVLRPTDGRRYRHPGGVVCNLQIRAEGWLWAPSAICRRVFSRTGTRLLAVGPDSSPGPPETGDGRSVASIAS